MLPISMVCMVHEALKDTLSLRPPGFISMISEWIFGYNEKIKTGMKF